MKVVTWNLQWARPESCRERAIREILIREGPGIVCLTEAFASTVAVDGELIEGGPGNRVADAKGAKKVLLWSRHGWLEPMVDQSFTPSGRVVEGVTLTEVGPVRVIGVCIPWRGSGTSRDGGDRRPWEDHVTFLKALKTRLSSVDATTIVLGDFNQRLPRQHQPRNVAEAMEAAFTTLVVGTRGLQSADGKHTIDHIAHSADLWLKEVVEIPRQQNGLELSDHFGVSGKLFPA